MDITIIGEMLKKQHSLSPSFHFYKFDSFPHAGGGPTLYVEFTGVEAPLKKNGQPDWKKKDKKTERIFNVTVAEGMELTEVWRIQTGKCVKCGGDGKVFQSWRLGEDVKYKGCAPCGGSGRDPSVDATVVPAAVTEDKQARLF